MLLFFWFELIKSQIVAAVVLCELFFLLPFFVSLPAISMCYYFSVMSFGLFRFFCPQILVDFILPSFSRSSYRSVVMLLSRPRFHSVILLVRRSSGRDSLLNVFVLDLCRFLLLNCPKYLSLSLFCCTSILMLSIVTSFCLLDL